MVVFIIDKRRTTNLYFASTALRRKRNGDTLLGYSGRTTLRREQCDEMPES
jgi:hypothetical protein